VEEKVRQEAEAAAAAAAAAAAWARAETAAEPQKETAEVGESRRPRARTLATAAFGEEEKEETLQKRQLIPIQYTDEERRAAIQGEAGAGELAAAAAAAQPAPAPGADLLRKQIMASIPKDREGVFSYTVKWEQLDDSPSDTVDRIGGWVGRKIKQLMGEEEPSFCEFIIQCVRRHESAGEMLEKLREVLDEDAENFVMNLFQVLIFESEKLAATNK